ncbi:hypothetical protein QRX60_28780 [Amycolatopsis mongoliensis]|uniref:Uncharacterized protein n=1 Tax=Amycolatopsis mongoliensis TaxID=715475 RepID=A0A9Y2JIS6_9PSEU|nr:hypothetical protein [Amycolatopsis sp. 4-36]WIX98061.1 hypothetical protein QRX60_28780 [Amycolatopsis sp. 4-36]
MLSLGGRRGRGREMWVKNVLWPFAGAGVAAIIWFTGDHTLAGYGWFVCTAALAFGLWEVRRRGHYRWRPPRPLPDDPGTPILPPDQDPVLVTATARRTRRARQTALLAAALAVTMAGIALLPLGPWRTPFVAMAFMAGSGVVAAMIDAVRFRRPLPGSWTELEVVGPASAQPWRLARTPEGTEFAFKLTATDDALTHHIEQTSRLRVLGEPHIGSPVRIAVPGQTSLGLAFFSRP